MEAALDVIFMEPDVAIARKHAIQLWRQIGQAYGSYPEKAVHGRMWMEGDSWHWERGLECGWVRDPPKCVRRFTDVWNELAS